MSSSALEVSYQYRLMLESWAWSSTVSAEHVERARIVLVVADGAAIIAATLAPSPDEARGDVLVFASAGPVSEDRRRHGDPGMEEVRRQALVGRGVHVLHRRGTGLEATVRDVVGLYLNPAAKVIGRRSFGGVKELLSTITAFMTGWSDRSPPFIWVNTAEGCSSLHPITRCRRATLAATMGVD